MFAGKQANGYWEIFVESEGDYEISLRRWPIEYNEGINSAPIIPADLKYLQEHHDPDRNYAITHFRGQAISATYARLVIQGYDVNKSFPENTDIHSPDYLTNEKGDITAVNFRLHLIKGSTRMSAWFVDGANDGEVFGVYYVYVKKLI